MRKNSSVAVSVISVAKAGSGSVSSMGEPGMVPSPMYMAAAVAMNCKARKNSRPMTPIRMPMTVSETSSAIMASGGIFGSAARSTGNSSGASAKVTATAMNSRTCTGTRELENPGISIRQPPMRQKARNTSSTVSGPMAVTRWCRAT